MGHERRIFIPGPITIGDEVTPKPADCRHLERALRLKIGDAVTIVGDQEEAFLGTVSNISPIRLKVHQSISAKTDITSCPVVHILCGLPKGPASDAIVEGASEFGVPLITFWQSDRSVPTDGTQRVGRWQKIAESAAKQSGQLRIPSVLWAPTLSEALENLTTPSAIRVLCSLQPDAKPLGSLFSSGAEKLIVAFGPEGDFTAAEEAMLQQADFKPTTLGNSRLRCQTAVIAALAGASALRLIYPQA
jgi:16S rRNA (uracil1498-N3)-methyltransferase